MRDCKFLTFIPCVLMILTIISCATYRLEKKLSSEEANWLSEVRYIITPEEKKYFWKCRNQKEKSS